MTGNRYHKSRALRRYLNPGPSTSEIEMLPVYRGAKSYSNVQCKSTNNVSVIRVHKFYVTRGC